MYTPPASGVAAPSSAIERAPARESAPPVTHMAMSAPTLPTRAATSCGTRKMPEPMIVPMTMAVEPSRPTARGRGAGDGECELAVSKSLRPGFLLLLGAASRVFGHWRNPLLEPGRSLY